MRDEQAVIMAAYNRWINERLYQACEVLPDSVRRQDRGAFFGSIHGTLNHLLLGDHLWMGRFLAQPFAVSSLRQELHADFASLKAAREQMDARIVEWAGRLTDSALAATFEFTPITNPVLRRCPLWVAVTHFFNHQTHHRGQLTALLSQAGVDYGITDLIGLPGLVEFVEAPSA